MDPALLPIKYHDVPIKEKWKVREAYVKLQEGKCCHCKEPLDGLPHWTVASYTVTRDLFPPNFFKNPVHLHHCHESGMTIGAVHCHCNAVLWEHFDE